MGDSNTMKAKCALPLKPCPILKGILWKWGRAVYIDVQLEFLLHKTYTNIHMTMITIPETKDKKGSS